jgi:hypothetical protein
LAGEVNAEDAPDAQIGGGRMVHLQWRGFEPVRAIPLLIGTKVMRKSVRDELTELSKQVVQLQFQLSLALLNSKQRPLQQPQPTNDNCAA